MSISSSTAPSNAAEPKFKPESETASRTTVMLAVIAYALSSGAMLVVNKVGLEVPNSRSC